MDKNIKIAVAGTGYVGLSIATLLAQHHQVTAVDVIPEKVDLINQRKSPIQDDYIEKYLAEKDLDLTADARMAFARDLYMLCFDLRGISFVDLAQLETAQLKNGYLTYFRQKTGPSGWTRVTEKSLVYHGNT